MMNNDIIKRLEELPQKIMDKEILLLESQDDLEEKQLRIKLIELNISDNVNNITDEKGKKIYSNKEKRDIETKKRLENNDEYKALTSVISDLTKKRKTDEIMIWYLKRKFSAAKALARLEVD